MARQNNEIELNFREINSDLDIVFEVDDARLPIEEINEVTVIPVVFEERTSRIPVILADVEDVNTIFSEAIVISGGSISGKCVVIESATGQFTNQQYAILDETFLNVISYNGVIFRQGYKDATLWTYYADTNDVNYGEIIKVYRQSKTWEFKQLYNNTLNTHIANTEIHVTAQQKINWENKISEVKVNNTALTPVNYSVNINVPIKLSQLENDVKYSVEEETGNYLRSTTSGAQQNIILFNKLGGELSRVTINSAQYNAGACIVISNNTISVDYDGYTLIKNQQNKLSVNTSVIGTVELINTKQNTLTPVNGISISDDNKIGTLFDITDAEIIF